MFLTYLLSFVLLALSVQDASAGGNDWVSPEFVLKKSSGASNAQRTVVSYAKSSASKGPWTVYGGDGSTLPPGGDRRDYLSWAPYHWPDCNWCQGGRTHLSSGGNVTHDDDKPDPGPEPEQSEDGGDIEYGSSEEQRSDNGSIVVPLLDLPLLVPLAHRKMVRRTRRFAHAHIHRDVANKSSSTVESFSHSSFLSPSSTSATGLSSTSTQMTFSAEAESFDKARKVAMTKLKGASTRKAAATKTQGSGSKCTPSPTKSLAPSATWTTCKYVTRDGKLNPDVRNLNGVNAIAEASQSIIYNAIASVLTGTASYAQSAAHAIDVFFLDAQSGMHPSISYGQLIRGPQKQTGQYLGVLDFRGMVKVVNAVMILQGGKASAWTASLDAKMEVWTTKYVKWLQTSAIGKKSIASPNNHGTFAANQVAAMSILIRDKNTAGSTLKSYFKGQFLDQIAASGEQPFEAVRTRPFHYRCFNLEAMITNAKLGDQLGLNFWTAKSKYGATIKDALDFVMNKGPGKEDVADIFPHVAAIAAVYGDPGGKYMAYLKKLDTHFMTAPYYYYDQTVASSGVHPTGKEEAQAGEPVQQPLKLDDDSVSSSSTSSIPTIPWECPAAFATILKVQLDDGVFVTCDELKPFYGYVKDAEKHL